MRLIGIGAAIGGVLALIGGAATATWPAASALAATAARPAASALATPNPTDPYALAPQVSVRIFGAGAVIGGPISCPRTCTHQFDSAVLLTLTPRPAPGHYFTYWGGACWGEGVCRVAINGPQTVEASFIALPNTQIASHRLVGTTLTVRMRGTGGAGRPQFRCRLDHGPFKTCAPRTTYGGLRRGRHTVVVQAIDGNSRRDPTPAALTVTVG